MERKERDKIGEGIGKEEAKLLIFLIQFEIFDSVVVETESWIFREVNVERI